ncbi:hypothetical protein AVEN_115026-1 [Araneus ventricosus]|uniref:Uncharacterized protein n=1 Tax=Araneus ventricosus TaxID=182803 RepID=A0A4Y1ZXJ2_ARAVE|nr:hypothetical protein AVEN_115026-1 [Araneus ventricosus]
MRIIAGAEVLSSAPNSSNYNVKGILSFASTDPNFPNIRRIRKNVEGNISAFRFPRMHQKSENSNTDIPRTAHRDIPRTAQRDIIYRINIFGSEKVVF